jgi:hypothetical protein
MRGRFVGSGFTLTILCWVIAALLSLGPVMGDCIGAPGQECPTDHQRDLDVLKIVLGAAFVNITGLFVIGYRYVGRDRP